MTLSELLDELRRKDIRLWLEGEQLRFDAPTGAMTETLRASIRQYRSDLLPLLSDEPGGRAPPLQPVPRDADLPLSFGQEQLWFLHQLQPDVVAYNVPATVRLSGATLHRDALQQSLDALVERHETLRTTFPTVDGRPRLVIAPPAPLALREEDLRNLPEGSRYEGAIRLAREDSLLPFDLGRGPLIRVALFRLGEADHVLHATLHHIISDGWSMFAFFRQLAASYDAFVNGRPFPLPDLPVQYVDYASWQRRRMQDAHLAKELAFWKNQLAGLSPLELPTDRPRPIHPSHRGGERKSRLPDDLSRAVMKLARDEGATSFMVLLSTFQILLARYSGQDDIVVGMPIAGRNRRELEDMVGFFVNNLVLRSDVPGNISFRELLGRVRRTTLDAFSHQEVPFETLVKELHPRREGAWNPLFQVLFNHFNVGEMINIEFGDLTLQSIRPTLQSSKFDLSMHCFESDGGLMTRVEYATDLFEATTALRISAHYQNLLEGVVAEPDRPISRLPMLDDDERRRLFHAWNRTARAHPATPGTIHGMLEEFARQAPDAPALVFEDRRLSRGEVDHRANALARLLRSRGVGREDRVGICVEPGVEMIIGLLGVLKAGAAYVPIEPTYPRERRQFILDDSGAVVLLTQKSLLNELPERRPQDVLCLDDELEPATGELPSVDPHDLAYVAYTSGSMGTPKGVEVEHRQLHAYLHDVLPRLALPKGASFATVSTVASDLGNTAIYGALCGGGVLHVIARERTRDGDALAEYVQREGIDCLKIMPSHLEALLASAAHPEDLLPRKLLVPGGEICTWELVDRVAELAPGCAVLNHYGPTETTVGVLTHRIRTGDRERHPVAPPIGKPLEHTRAYILDDHDQPVPIGIAGELCIAGANVARGYRNQPELNEKQYARDPFGEPGERMYRTGDRVRLRPDGEVQFLGRRDEQVKIRGYRVEPGEVKERLERIAGVKTCAVVAREDDSPAVGLRLVAYVVPAGEEPVEPVVLRNELKRHLPEYMIPSAFVFLGALPLRANGKLDRDALPAPASPSGASAPVFPRDPEEEALARIWSQVLQTERVGVHDNFFDLGGDSILGIQIVARARRVGLPLQPRDLLLHPTVAEMARVAREKGLDSSASTGAVAAVAPPAPEAAGSSPFSLARLRPEERTRIEERYGAAGIEEVYPLSPLQTGLVYHVLTEPDSRLYVLQAAVTLRGELDATAFREAWRRTVDRHETLRTAFVTDELETMHQIVCRQFELPWREDDWYGLDADERQARLDDLEGEELRPGFDLACAPLLRLRLVRITAEEHRFVLTVHHVLLDGWSLPLVIASFFREYAAIMEGRPIRLEDPPRYSEHIRWLQKQDDNRAQAYWRNALRDWEHFPLPLHRRESPRAAGARESRSVDLSEGTTQALRSFARQHRLTLNTVVLGAWALLLSRYSARTDVSFGVTVSGRSPEVPNVESIVGSFINTLPLRVEAEDDELIPWLQKLQSRQIELQEFAYTPLIEVQRLVETNCQKGLFDSIFVFENYPSRPTETAAHGLQIENVHQHTYTHYPLTAVVRPGRELRLEFQYDPNRGDDGIVGRMLRHFAALLEGFVERPAGRLFELRVLSAEERHSILVEWNDTQVDYPRDGLVHELFADHARRTPGALAVSGPDQRTTYAELNDRADQVARHLSSRGVRPGTKVAVCIGRGVHLAAASLGVMKAGGAYVPMNPEDPPRRLQALAEEVKAPVVLTLAATADQFAQFAGEVIRLDESGLELERGSEGRPATTPGAEDTAYVIFTSGSTGRPKGVEVSHGSLLNLVHWYRCAYGVTSQDRGSQVAAVGFDASMLELWPFLTSGASVHVPEEEDRRDPSKMWSWLERERVTITFFPTPYAEIALREPLPEGLALRYLLVGGDRLGRPPAAELPFEFVNLYGPAECTVVATAARVAPQTRSDSPPPIGRPIANVLALVLDEHLEPVPIGVPGELFLGGESLARGYHGLPEETADRFVENPFEELAAASPRLYRTGDRVRFREDGNLEFQGRIDDQVKIRGFRIEPAEVESALVRNRNVQAAAVVAREDLGELKRLVAYVVPERGRNLSWSALREALSETLPRHMIPAAFVQLQSLPMTRHGKLDRRSLPAPEKGRRVEEPVLAPRNEFEEEILAAWREALGVQEVGIADNFFDLGGDSLRVLQVHRRLAKLKADLTVTALFQFPTVEALAKHLDVGKIEDDVLRRGAEARVASARGRSGDRFAVIAMAGRFPGAQNVETLWQNLQNGVEALRQFSDEELREAGIPEAALENPRFVKVRPVLDGIDQFDAAFFGYSPREAEILDPQQRLFMECAWEALERAGYDSKRFPGLIAVYAGTGLSFYAQNLQSGTDLRSSSSGGVQTAMAIDKDFLATRVSYVLDLRGPSMAVQTACSTSLVAIHQACQSLAAFQCDIALAGGARIIGPSGGYMYEPGGIQSPDGHCRPFDAGAGGTVAGDGVGIVVLRRLEDALTDGDPIHAIIRGSAVNNDGSLKTGYTAPSLEGQSKAIAWAQAVADVDPETITYVEAHGTATALGDPIEVSALARVFGERTSKRGYCALGSIKANIGHLGEAAGAAGMIKTVLALKHRQLPPSINYETSNPELHIEESPFYVNTECRDWEKTDGFPRRAGVSSFGLGGTNAHAIVEEAPTREPSGPSRPWQLLLLSAKGPAALRDATRNLVEHLRRCPAESLADMAYTLQVGRRGFALRRVVVCREPDEAIQALERPDRRRADSGTCKRSGRPVAFLFSGQGAQYPNMLRGIYETEATFRAEVDRCCELLVPHLGLDLRKLLFPAEDELETVAKELGQTQHAQPALFAVEYALAKLWMEWGVEPESMVGHSFGEYVAACLAGVFTLEQALELVAARGRLIGSLPASGGMLSVSLAEGELAPLLEDGLSIAAINAPELCVVSGSLGAFARLEESLEEKGVSYRRLPISNASHSSLMDPILAEFRAVVERIGPGVPERPFISCTTGTWIRPEEAADPAYWQRHLRQPVRFGDCVAKLLEDPKRVLLEVGPGNILTTLGLASAAASGKEDTQILASTRHPHEEADDQACLLLALGKLWIAGVEIDWDGFYARERRRRVELPTYPFQRERFWVGREGAPRDVQRQGPVGGKRDLSDWFYVPVWKQIETPDSVPGATDSGMAERCLAFDDGSEFSQRVIAGLERKGTRVLRVLSGETFERSENGWVLDPRSPDDYQCLVDELVREGRIPELVVHLWGVGLDPGDLRHSDDVATELQYRGFFSLFFLARALDAVTIADSVRIVTVTAGVHDVTGGEPLYPEKATVLGPCRVIGLEFSKVSCRCVDLAVEDLERGTQKHLEALLRELVSTSDDAVVALRKGRRWVESFVSHSLSEPADVSPPARLRPGGTYLVTGGFTGVGAVLAKTLAESVGAKLALVGRTRLPERAEWPEILASPSDGDPLARRIRTVLSLEAAGAEVLPLCADVADMAQMRSAMTRIEDLLGPVNGVVHAAGILPGGLIAAQEPDQPWTVLAPKFYGTRVLERLFRERDLDFLLLCSSINSVAGVPGLADYSGANAYLDAFARRFTADTGKFCLSVNWNRWEGVGMGEGIAQAPADGDRGMSKEEGAEVFRRILDGVTTPQVLVWETDLPSFLRRLVQKLEAGSQPSIPADADAENEPGDMAAGPSHHRPDLAPDYVEPETETEKHLARIWQDVLGIDRVGMHDSFLELGGTSLLIVQVTERWERETGQRVSLRGLFHQTLGQLAAMIDEKKEMPQPVPQPRGLRGLLSRLRRSTQAPLRHPLFRGHTVESPQRTVYTSRLTTDDWVLADHRISGTAALPGTAYLELARAAFEHWSGATAIEMQDVFLLRPIFVEEGSVAELRTVLQSKEDEVAFSIEKRLASSDDDWQPHATGKIARLLDEAPRRHSIRELEARVGEQPGPAHASPRRSSLSFGPRWNCLKSARLGDTQGFARFELDGSFSKDLKSYKLHPALLDGATGFLTARITADDDQYLPLSYGRVRMARPLPRKLFSYASLTNASQDAETIQLDVVVMDERGQELVAIEKYTLRKVGETAARSAQPPASIASRALVLAEPGGPESLKFEPLLRRAPGPGEVEIEVAAAGLAFKEVLFALGAIPDPPDGPLGLEGAGTISAIGPDVTELNPGARVMGFGKGCFGSFFTTSADFVAPLPPKMSFEQAATIPSAFLTAYHALVNLGRLRSGERILIHAAAGGVGMAAVQIARRIGAEVFATAGSPEKRAFLQSLGIEHVMDSRSLAFAEEVLRFTDGSGVDAVLNSLSGEFVPKGLSILAPYGRFLELGVRDAHEDRALGMRPFSKGLSFFAVQAGPQMRDFGDTWSELVEQFSSGTFQALPYRLFPIDQASDAFSYMARAQQIGKVVLKLRDDAAGLSEPRGRGHQ